MNYAVAVTVLSLQSPNGPPALRIRTQISLIQAEDVAAAKVIAKALAKETLAEGEFIQEPAALLLP